VFKPNLAQGGRVSDPFPTPLNRPLSLCSSQIRLGDGHLLLGARMSRAASRTIAHRPARGPTRGDREQAGMPPCPSRARFSPPFVPSCPAEPSVQADLRERGRSSTPFRPPSIGRDPCVQARSGVEDGILFLGSRMSLGSFSTLPAPCHRSGGRPPAPPIAPSAPLSVFKPHHAGGARASTPSRAWLRRG
jgi:hypothetical protein